MNVARAGGCCSFVIKQCSHTCCLKRDCGTFGQHRSQKNPSSEPAPPNSAKCARRISWLRSSRLGRFRTATRFFWHLPFFRLTSYYQQRYTGTVSASSCFTLPRVASVNTPATGRAYRAHDVNEGNHTTHSRDWRTEEASLEESLVLNMVSRFSSLQPQLRRSGSEVYLYRITLPHQNQDIKLSHTF